MTKRLDKARKYVELYQMAMNDGHTQKANVYILRATSILTDIYETTENEEEIKDMMSLTNEILEIDDKS